MLLDGYTQNQIAYELNMSGATVSNRIWFALKEYGFANKYRMMIDFYEKGFIK